MEELKIKRDDIKNLVAALNTAMQIPHHSNNHFAKTASKLRKVLIDKLHACDRESFPKIISPSHKDTKEITAFRKAIVELNKKTKFTKAGLVEDEKLHQKQFDILKGLHSEAVKLLEETEGKHRLYMMGIEVVAYNTIAESDVPPVPGEVYEALSFMFVLDSKILKLE